MVSISKKRKGFSMKKWLVIIINVLLIAVTLIWFNINPHLRVLILDPPENENVLFWSTKQRDAGFRLIEQLDILPKRTIKASEDTSQFKIGNSLDFEKEALDQLMKSQRLASLIVLHNGKLVLEEYGLDFSAEGKWTSFSVAKSFTSTLIGAAIKDGYINSLSDSVSLYIPDMQGSNYDNVTIEQLLTMTSGIKWDEDYSDPNSDVSKFNFHTPDEGIDATASYMRSLPRAAEPGKVWLYSTGETNLIGLLISQATNQTLSDYLSEKVWSKIGMEQDASWVLGKTGHEISGCCIQATTRDFARFGQFILNGAIVDGESIVPDGWFEKATTTQFKTSNPKLGYGFQWWTSPDGSFQGRGIFGQGIFIDPTRKLVIAVNGNWEKASSRELTEQRLQLYKLIQDLVDDN